MRQDCGHNGCESTHPVRVWQAKVWPGFVSNSGVNHFSNNCDGDLRTIGREPYKTSIRSFLRVLGEVNGTEVYIIRPFHESDGRRLIKNDRESKGLIHCIKQ